MELQSVLDSHIARVVDVKHCGVEEGVLKESLQADVSHLSEVGMESCEEVLRLLEEARTLGELFEVNELRGLQGLRVGPRVSLDHRYDDLHEIDVKAATELVNEELETPEYRGLQRLHLGINA